MGLTDWYISLVMDSKQSWLASAKKVVWKQIFPSRELKVVKVIVFKTNKK
jgi:hypothetical protein